MNKKIKKAVNKKKVYNDVLLHTITKVSIIIILTYSLYMFFGGHHHPGGGFVGGLGIASGLVLLLLSFGTDVFHENVPFDYLRLAASGALIALGVGFVSILFDQPFLTQVFGYVYIPVIGETELASALIFDLGVAMTVIGSAMTIITTISEDDV